MRRRRGGVERRQTMELKGVAARRDRNRGAGGEMRAQKSLRNGVHNANANVRRPVCDECERALFARFMMARTSSGRVTTSSVRFMT